ncbi:hypothetical protein QFC20_000740 [Naganishia adeliensis]|uniref:Uncharacterized protein n=1 Tax=Naganishia adeliensis TaxID=92952 RepID=A0ACC2WYE6_9TREE|nr:hypothetical protein QFC20_000740 [Naganishia adeliensis]
MQDRKPKTQVTGKIHIPSAAQPALRARTRNVVDPPTPPTSTRPVARTAASLVGGSPGGLAPRRVGIVRASTTSVLGNGGTVASVKTRSEVGSDVGNATPVSARVKRVVNGSTPIRTPPAPPLPALPASAGNPVTPNPTAYALQRETAAPLVSPRSGRREAGRRTRVALGASDTIEDELPKPVSPVQTMSQQGGRTRVRIQGSILSRSTASTYTEEPIHSSPSTSGDSASDDDASVSGDEQEPPLPLVISEEIRRRILDEEDAKRSRKIADLEISNASLLTINRTLEAEVARKTRLISGLKRQLRASGQVIAPLPSDTESESSYTSSEKGKRRENPEEEDAEIQEAHQTTRAHADELAEVNGRLEALVQRGREAVRRVEGMTSGGKGKVLSSWEVAVDDVDRDGSASERGEEEGAVD